MGIQAQFLMMVGMVICLTSAAYADQGTATYYAPPYVSSACYGNQDNGNMVAGASDAIWNNGAACGTNYKVKCIGPANTAPHPCKNGESIVVKIVDYCAKCNGTINLSQDAFSKISNLEIGKIMVEYDRV
uniref:Expansin-like EG45 domain-containing protein n=1 Tax=Davidia involucrata TaxID=16924 RepID=A0A5B7BHB1_DAVIN